MNGLVRIGAITKDQAKQHFDRVEERYAIQEKQHHEKQFKSFVETLGVTAVRKMLKELK